MNTFMYAWCIYIQIRIDHLQTTKNTNYLDVKLHRLKNLQTIDSMEYGESVQRMSFPKSRLLEKPSIT